MLPRLSRSPFLVELAVVVEVVAVVVVVVPRASREAGPVFLVLIVNCIDHASLNSSSTEPASLPTMPS